MVDDEREARLMLADPHDIGERGVGGGGEVQGQVVGGENAKTLHYLRPPNPSGRPLVHEVADAHHERFAGERPGILFDSLG